MSLVDSYFLITWYPGAPGMTDDPKVLLEVGDLIDHGSPLAGMQSQVVQPASYVRGDQPNHWPRGGRRALLNFSKTKAVDEPHEAAELGLIESAGMPDQEGWLHIKLDDGTGAGLFRATEWQVDNVALSGIDFAVDATGVLVTIRYRMQGGRLSVYTGPATAVYSPGAYLREDSTLGAPVSVLREDAF